MMKKVIAARTDFYGNLLEKFVIEENLSEKDAKSLIDDIESFRSLYKNSKEQISKSLEEFSKSHPYDDKSHQNKKGKNKNTILKEQFHNGLLITYRMDDLCKHKFFRYLDMSIFDIEQ